MSSPRRQNFVRELRARRRVHAIFGQKIPKKLAKRLPKQMQPDPQRALYLSALKRGPLALLRSLIDRYLVPALPAIAARAAAHQVKHDAADDLEDPNDVVDEMADAWARTMTTDRAAEIVQPVAHSVNEFTRAQFNRQIKAAVGVDVISSEPWLQPAVTEFTTANVALIKSIGAEAFPDLEKRLAQGISDGMRQEELAEMIEQRFGVAESKAALIARDQVGKFAANLNERRQADLGISKYVWTTAGDNRVREEHAEREGEVYSWDDPPSDEDFGPVNPGEAINCRCIAEPVLDEIFDSLTGDDA